MNGYFIHQLRVLYKRAASISESKHLLVLVSRAINNYLDSTVAVRWLLAIQNVDLWVLTGRLEVLSTHKNPSQGHYYQEHTHNEDRVVHVKAGHGGGLWNLFSSN